MIPAGERQQLIRLIREAMAMGCRLRQACEEVEISLRTYRRWYVNGEVQTDKRPLVKRRVPACRLDDTERGIILEVCNEPAHASLPPSQIVPKLLDQGIYHASESTFYRILKEHDQLKRRGRSLAPVKRHKPTSHTAYGPNEVWSWDITYLPSRVKGLFFYLYMFLDIFSRKIVGYEVHDAESGEQAAVLLQRSLLRENCLGTPVVLHSDNGAAMKSLTLKAKMEEMGVMSSYSRPRVSNDNPFSESAFKTLKYRPEWPATGFTDIEKARDWVQTFVTWYNEEHYHSSLRFVTPAERHAGKDAEVLANRKTVLEAAREKNPRRWAGDVRNCEPIGPVTLNPDKPENSAIISAA